MIKTSRTHTETKHQSTSTPSTPCSCGCAPCEETCCQLDCLVQPRFFCGQLLTDADLTRLLTWSQGKFRLSRFRHGWGVVCGLEVHCDPQAGGVRVSPGYAVDCCGNDIMVCEEVQFPLDDACYLLPDPCAQPEKATNGEYDGPIEMINFFGCPVPRSEVREKVLTIRYAEVPSDFQTALGQNGCGRTDGCQASRTRESFNLAWEDAVDRRVAVDKWRKEYEACLDVISRYRTWIDSHPNAGNVDIQRWLLDWIDGFRGLNAHPLYQLCWLRDCLCNAEALDTINERLIGILFWLVQDRRNHFLSCECCDCPEDHGVPLARVCLRVPQQGRCSVLAVDPYPPYRRPLRLDCWPALPGFVNAGPAIWQPTDQARELLAGLGLVVDPNPVQYEMPGDLDTLQSSLTCELIVRRGETVALQVYNGEGCLGERVVGICGVPVQETEEEISKEKTEPEGGEEKVSSTTSARRKRKG